MELKRNAFKAALREGRRQIGLWCTIPDSGVVELLAGCGYDWLLIDTEHSPMDPVQTMPLMQAAAPYPVSAMCRPAWNDAVLIKKLLDCGAQSLLVPFVQNAEEAEAAVRATRYPPHGIRGVSGCTRANAYGSVAGYAKRAEEELCVILQVETVEAVDRIEEIAQVEGVDGIFVGPADLAASMGRVGEPAHPEVREAVTEAVRRIRAAGLPPGVLSSDRPLLESATEAGAQFIAVGVDAALLRRGAAELRDSW
ncbi:HpcH/HpaI aldolase family protein [Salipiger mucosus]|uniref:Hydroxypyruvate/pyruvate aldolase n=1 Tax=Salipiger mucosus DSM 16094 TaxID=1123237 RepID=S9QIM2_9RHOB|nr:aldolase/citrate lyase family protein [Salipiger mucosus]EPX79637.1 2,4-dihydroxyhept-2-ene-1,7-dioic acid aldolase [Salipiger mucosus DSM 16094]